MEECDCNIGESLKQCLAKCKCCPLVMLVGGIILFLVVYFLSASVVKMVALIMLAIIGVLGAICLCKKGEKCQEKQEEE